MHDWHRENDDSYYEHLEDEDQYVGNHPFLRDRNDRLATYPRTPEGDILLEKDEWTATLTWDPLTGVTIKTNNVTLNEHTNLLRYTNWLQTVVTTAAADYDNENRSIHSWENHGLLPHNLHFINLGQTRVWISNANNINEEDLPFGTPYITWEPNFPDYNAGDPEWACYVSGLDDSEAFEGLLGTARWEDTAALTRLAEACRTTPDAVLIHAALINSTELASIVKVRNTSLELNAIANLPDEQKINYRTAANLLNTTLPPVATEHWVRARIWPIASHGKNQDRNLAPVIAVTTYTPTDNTHTTEALTSHGYHPFGLTITHEHTFVTTWTRTPHLLTNRPYAHDWYTHAINERLEETEQRTYHNIQIPIDNPDLIDTPHVTATV